MEGRIVLSFRAASGQARSFLVRGRALIERASSAGGELVAWDGARVSLAFPVTSLAEAIALALADDAEEGERPWAVGAAQGDLETLARVVAMGTLAWGRAVVEASLLAGRAEPGEILVAESVRGPENGELALGKRKIAREGDLRVRGFVLEREHPIREKRTDQIAHMRTPRLHGIDPSRVVVAPGALVVVRADPGTGGTRLLAEVAERAPRALFVSPSGSGFEPLGSLRRAFARSDIPDPHPVEIAQPLESLMRGEGTSLEAAVRLVTVFLAAKTAAGVPNVLAIDDAKNVDPASLEACVRAARGSRSFGLVARLDATSGLPSVLAALGNAAEIEIAPLSTEGAEALAGACANGMLDAVAKKRWGRLGAHVPLGIVEAVAFGIVSGELVFRGDVASPRSRTSGRGKALAPSEWIRRRAESETLACRAVLYLIAILGGEAKLARLSAILDATKEQVYLEQTVAELVRKRWLVDTQEDWVALPSRTHRDALARLVEEPTRKAALHTIIADVIEREEGTFGRVDAAWHAVQAGDGARASAILLDAAKRAAEAKAEASTTQLIAYARRVDPSCEEAAFEILANALERAPSVQPEVFDPNEPDSLVERAIIVPPDGPVPEFDTTTESEPPTVMRAPKQESASPPSDAPGSKIAVRLGELAKEALLASDNAALERWVDGLRAAGESPVFTDRMRALARLGRGDIGDALRVLKRTRQALDPTDHALRCQTSLALGVALSVAGRTQEALLEGLDALARAKESDDQSGAKACLAFLAKLYVSVKRPDEADKLLRAAQGP